MFVCPWKSILQNTTGLNVNFTVLYVKLIDFSSVLNSFGEIFEKRIHLNRV